MKSRLLSLLLCLAALPALAAESPAQKPVKKAKPQLVEAITLAEENTRIVHERTGSLDYRRQVRIHNQEEGRILELPWYEGDRVEKDELLVRIDDRLIQAELDKGQAELSQAKRDLQRLQGLAKRKAVSEDELQRAKTSLEVLQSEVNLLNIRVARARIRAPFAGVITERLAEPEDVAKLHTHLLTLADPDSLYTQVRASDLLLPHLRVGDPVSVRIDALGRVDHAGRILRIHPTIDPVTRQGEVEVLLEPVHPGARAGQFARVTLSSRAIPRMMIPFNALRRDRDGEYVFVVAEGKAKRAAVRSGLRLEDRIELLSGVEPGQQVIVRGFLGLNDGKTVKIVTPKR